MALFGGMGCDEQIGGASTDVCLLVFHIMLSILTVVSKKLTYVSLMSDVNLILG